MSSHHSTSAYQLHITTQHPASHLSTDPPKCFAHPSSRARAQLPLLATSPPPPSAWLRAPPALELQGLLVPLAGESMLMKCKPYIQTNRYCSDAFTKREAASEELYIRQEEKAKYVLQLCISRYPDDYFAPFQTEQRPGTTFCHITTC